MDTTASIFKAAGRFFSGTALSRISGMLRDMSMAYAFGTQELVAAFFVAFRLAHLFRRLLGEGALQSAFIPFFEEMRIQSPQTVYLFFRNLKLALSAVLIGLILLCMGVFWGYGFFMDISESNSKIIYFALWMMPSLFFICLYGINAAFLQCEKSYFLPGVAPVAFNLAWIAAVFLLASQPIETAMYGLCIAVTTGCFLQWAVTLPKTYKLLKINNVPLVGRFSLKQSGILKFITPLTLGTLGIAAGQFNNALDSLFARAADPEGPAFLWYAIRLQQLPLALFGIALAGAILPPLSRAIKQQKLEDFRLFLRFGITKTIWFMLGITALTFLFGRFAITLLYGRGDFGTESIEATLSCLLGYAAGLTPSALVLILAPAFYSMNDFKTPTFAALGSVLFHCALNSLFVFGFGWGAESIAYSTSAAALLNAAWLGIALAITLRTHLFYDQYSQ